MLTTGNPEFDQIKQAAINGLAGLEPNGREPDVWPAVNGIDVVATAFSNLPPRQQDRIVSAISNNVVGRLRAKWTACAAGAVVAVSTAVGVGAYHLGQFNESRAHVPPKAEAASVVVQSESGGQFVPKGFYAGEPTTQPVRSEMLVGP